MFAPEDVLIATDAIQKVVALSFALSLALCLILSAHWHRLRPYLIVALTVAVHSVIFYAFALTDSLHSPWGNFWSSLLRLHTGVALSGTLIAVGLALSRTQDGYDR